MVESPTAMVFCGSLGYARDDGLGSAEEFVCFFMGGYGTILVVVSCLFCGF